MEVIVAFIALIGGFIFGRRSGAKAVLPALTQVSNTQAIDRGNYLQTLRRELANILIWRDPRRYLQLYKQLHMEVTSLASWRLEEVDKRLAELCRKYPNYSDFDAIGTREYVLYPDGASSMDLDELEARYKDLVMFPALSSIADESWKDPAVKLYVNTTSDKELVHLSDYVQKIEDTKLILRLERAVEDDAMRRYEADGSRDFDNDFYLIKHLPHFAESRYSIHLKRTNEFAIYSFFMFDDGRIKESYFRSDPSFQTEQRLSPLLAVLEQLKLAR